MITPRTPDVKSYMSTLGQTENVTHWILKVQLRHPGDAFGSGVISADLNLT